MTDVKIGIPRGGDDRGEKGHRDHRRSATNLVGPTTGPGALVADEDIPAGSVVAAGGSAVLAVGDLNAYCTTHPTDNKCRNCIIDPFSVPPNKAESCGVKGVVGVASALTATGQPTHYVAAGPLTLDTAVWDANTGGSGGLIPNAIYYLSATVPGRMTNFRPTSGRVIQVGVAFDARTLNVRIDEIGLAGPTTEHIVTVANAAVADPDVEVTFVTEGSDADGRQDISLANGSVDGFEKTIMWPQGAIPVVGYRVLPDSGPVVNFGDTPGAVTYRWDAVAVAWLVQSTRNSV